MGEKWLAMAFPERGIMNNKQFVIDEEAYMNDMEDEYIGYSDWDDEEIDSDELQAVLIELGVYTERTID
jgi:hypothetical protein